MSTPYRPTSPAAVYARIPFRFPMPYGILPRGELGFWPGTPAIEGGDLPSLRPSIAPGAIPAMSLTDRDWQIAAYLADLFQLPNPAPNGVRSPQRFWTNVQTMLGIFDSCGVASSAVQAVYMNTALDAANVRLALARLIVNRCPTSRTATRMRAFWGPGEGVNVAVGLGVQTDLIQFPTGGLQVPPPPPPEPEKKGFPAWGYALGGVGALVLIGGGIYFATRKRKRRNPCMCPNPSGDFFGSPMVSPSVDRNVLSTSHSHLWGEPYTPFQNPRRRRRARR